MAKERFNAIDIANWFLWKNEVERIENENELNDYEVYEKLTHLKLQKLIYFAQGMYLAFTRNSLFEENIEAWEHGPVVRTVYDKFKTYKKLDIDKKLTSSELDTIKEIEKDEEISEILNLVYDNYGGYTAWQLRELSHVPGGPWQVTVATKGMNSEIEHKLMIEYFSQYIIANG